MNESQSGRPVATFSVLTRARHRGADRYKLKLVDHRIKVFDRELTERMKDISLDDGVFVQGCLASFRKSTNDWMQSITAQNVILHSEGGKQSASEPVMAEVGEKVEEEKEKEEAEDGTTGKSF